MKPHRPIDAIKADIQVSKLERAKRLDERDEAQHRLTEAVRLEVELRDELIEAMLAANNSGEE